MLISWSQNTNNIHKQHTQTTYANNIRKQHTQTTYTNDTYTNDTYIQVCMHHAMIQQGVHLIVIVQSWIIQFNRQDMKYFSHLSRRKKISAILSLVAVIVILLLNLILILTLRDTIETVGSEATPSSTISTTATIDCLAVIRQLLPPLLLRHPLLLV